MLTQAETGTKLLRIGAAAIMIIHGVTRLKLATVDDFGGFLLAQGIPFGVAVAWGLTAVEVIGGGLLALGRYVWPLCAFFMVELAVGVYMVHWKQGWFVVGAGTGGSEYSALLILCFLVVGLTEGRSLKPS